MGNKMGFFEEKASSSCHSFIANRGSAFSYSIIPPADLMLHH